MVRSLPQENMVGELLDGVAAACGITETTGVTGELAFMEYILAQLLADERQPAITFTEEEREAIEEERIGEDFLRYPFLY